VVAVDTILRRFCFAGIAVFAFVMSMLSVVCNSYLFISEMRKTPDALITGYGE